MQDLGWSLDEPDLKEMYLSLLASATDGGRRGWRIRLRDPHRRAVWVRGGAVKARIYDKTEESRLKGSDWWPDN